MATTTSNSPGCAGGAWRARMNTVSGANGPRASMPSARAAATAGAMCSISSRPKRPPSPACGFSPATAMRGGRCSAAPTDRCAIRRVSRMLPLVTISMASRSETWMLTSTVRNSSLASIMRTGTCATGRPRCRAASACSNSVWPGKALKGAPAADSASLCSGAVTMPATSPRSAARAAQTTLSPASRPASALTWPKSTGSAPSSTCSTGTQRGGAASASSGVSMATTGKATSGATTWHARRSSATSPATKQPAMSSGA